MAGLCVALALSGSGRQVSLLAERDPPPADGEPDDQAFSGLGAPRGRASCATAHCLPGAAAQPDPRSPPPPYCRLYGTPAADRSASKKSCRTPCFRPTSPGRVTTTSPSCPAAERPWKQLVRAYVANLTDVEIVSGSPDPSAGLSRRPKTAPLKVIGLSAARLQARHSRRTAISSSTPAAAIRTPSTSCPSGRRCGPEGLRGLHGIVYFTRHYRLRPGQDEPARGARPAPATSVSSSSACFPGDNRCFLGHPGGRRRSRLDLRQALARPEGVRCGRLRRCSRASPPGPTAGPRRAGQQGVRHGRFEEPSGAAWCPPDQRASRWAFFAVGDSLVSAPIHCSAVAVRSSRRSRPRSCAGVLDQSR